MIQRAKALVLAVLGWAFYKVLSATWKIKIIEPESLTEARLNSQSCIFAHWHGDELAILHLLAPYRVCTMISTSKDGELMARLVRLLGGKTSRGSSTRGGVSALRGILRLVKAGYRPSVAVDGPKGPIHKVKPGIFELAKILQLPIYPMGISVTDRWSFPRSWNQTYLPKFFSQVVIFFGDPMPPSARDSDPRDPAVALDLEMRLMAARDRAKDSTLVVRRI